MERPRFWPSVMQWIMSGTNSLAHMVPLLCVSPFSRRAAWAIYRHWGRSMCRIFGITLSLRDDNEGRRGPEPHLYVWLNQTSLSEVPAFATRGLTYDDRDAVLERLHALAEHALASERGP